MDFNNIEQSQLGANGFNTQAAFAVRTLSNQTTKQCIHKINTNQFVYYVLPTPDNGYVPFVIQGVNLEDIIYFFNN